MKKIFSIAIITAVILTVFSLTVYAESSDVSQITSTSASGSGYSPVELAVAICSMFAIISVIGVMFIKTVMKNNNNRLK